MKQILFIAFAVLFVIASVYHFLNVFYKYDASPIWRHLLFVGIDLFSAYGFLKRPKYFVYFVAVLLVQQYYSHGTYLINLWVQEKRIHWISVFDLILLPFGLICLIKDKQKTGHNNELQ